MGGEGRVGRRRLTSWHTLFRVARIMIQSVAFMVFKTMGNKRCEPMRRCQFNEPDLPPEEKNLYSVVLHHGWSMGH